MKQTTKTPNTHTAPSSQYTPYEMPGILDREIGSAQADKFGHHHFARALADLIEVPGHTPPFSIGLLGGWGTGKSSIKSLYVSGLKDDETKLPHGSARRDRYQIITFNAWRYGGEPIRRALLRQVFCDLGGEESEITDRLFNQVQHPTFRDKDLKTIAREIYDKYPWLAVQILLVAALALVLTAIARWMFKLDDQWVTTVNLTIGSLLVGWITSVLLDPKRFAISRYSNITRVELPTVSAEQYEQLIAEQASRFKKKHPSSERIVIFVDDLDRLSAEEMISGLDAVRALMEISSERMRGLGIVFVISCDEDRIAEALATRRRRGGAEVPAVILSQADARRYLDRIFQFRLEIPPFPRQDMRSFAKERLREDMAEVAAGIERVESTVEDVVERMIHVGVQNPRNALQILNAFGQTWWLAERREREGAGTDQRGALSEGAVTRWPEGLAVLCALRVDFPDFYAHLLKTPDLIQHFTDTFIHKKPVDELPEGVRLLLECYAVPPSADREQPQILALKSEHRLLRQFLASTLVVPWPTSLMPLLLLSQDPVARRTGDGGLRTYDALVSGDVDGVLEALGRKLDTRPLDTAQVLLLRDLAEQVNEDTETRRDNAAAVLAGLADRYPAADARHLLGPLARRLAASPSLRGRVGVSTIANLLPRIYSQDQRLVAGRLVGDLFSADGSVTLKMPSGDTPSLQEAVEMARAGAEAILIVRGAHGLDSSVSSTFDEWLLTRPVKVGTKNQNLPVDDLEGWMARHEGHLLDSLSLRYAQLIVDLLPDDAETLEAPISLSEAMRRIEHLLTQMWDKGEESRDAAWNLVLRLSAVNPLAANQVAQRQFRQQYAHTTPSVTSAFVMAVAARVGRWTHSDGLDEVDNDGVGQIVRAARDRKSGLGDAAISAVAKLCIGLSAQDKTSGHAVIVFGALEETGADGVLEVLTNWTARAFTDLPDDCLDMLSHRFSQFPTSELRTALTASLDQVSNTAPLESEMMRRYVKVINTIPATAFEQAPLKAHLAQMLPWFAQQYASMPIMEGLLPALLKMVEVGSGDLVGPTLNTLVRQSAAHHEVHSLIHRTMQGHWPTVESFSPLVPFNAGRQVISETPAAPWTPGILASLGDLVRSGQVGRDQEPVLIETAVATWQPHIAASADALLACESTPSPAIIADLGVRLPSTSEADSEILRRTWRSLQGRASRSERQAVTQALLQQPPGAIGEVPDALLTWWLDAVATTPAEMYPMLETLLTPGLLIEDQGYRIWKQVEQRFQALTDEQILALLRLALEHEATVSKAALDTQTEITAQFPQNEDGRYKLASCLLDIIPLSRSMETKNRLITWIQDLKNETILKNVNSENGFSEEDIRLLASRFTQNRHLKALIRSMEKNGE